jgi:carnitine O-acetyltransferase
MNVVKTGYGKQAIKAARASPDAWAQLLLQLAYARLLRARGWKRQGGTYESATTRRFFKGRTEVVRVVTSESDAFVRAMMVEDGTDADAGVKDKRALFERAAKAHVANAQAAGRGEGVDRHLLGKYAPGNSRHLTHLELTTCMRALCFALWILGLRKVLKEGESVPEIFEDPVMKRASHWVLSTSALFSKHLREYGWGEVRLSDGEYFEF